jgi:ATP-dependent Clp protease protease subunit
MVYQDQVLNEMILNDYKYENTIYLNTEVDRDSQVKFTRQLRKLAEQELVKPKSEQKPIKVRISSFGGWVISLFAITSYMEYYKEKGVIIETYCDGFCCSAGAKILMCGSKGHRYSTRRAMILIHQTQFGGSGHMTLQEKRQQNIYDERDWKVMCDLFRENTDLTEEDIKNFTERNLDVEYSPIEALKKGIIDDLI